MTKREGKKSLYLEAEAVDMLKEAINEWFYYKGIKLVTISQIVVALLNDYNEKKAEK